MFQVYQIENTVNNKYYIGVHNGDIYRDKYYGSGTYLNKSIRKNGKSAFNRYVISEFKNPDLAYFLEMCIVGDEVVVDKNSYNITNGGGNPPTFKGEDHYGFGKKRDKRTIKKISKANKIRFKDPNERIRISESLKGITPWNKGKKGIYSEETIKKMSKAKQGVKQSVTHIMAVSKALMGRSVSKETRIKIAETKYRAVIQYDVLGNKINEYNSQKEASKITGINRTCITACVNERQHTAGGYKWKYKTN